LSHPLSFTLTSGYLVMSDGNQTFENVQIASLSGDVLLRLDANVTLSADGNSYTVAVTLGTATGPLPTGGVVIPKAAFDALIAAEQASYDADEALTEATADVTDAVAAFGTTPAPTELSAYDTAILNLSTAEDASETFELAYDAWSLLDDAFVELSLLGVEAAALEADFVTALESIENATNAVAPLDPGLGVNVVGLGTPDPAGPGSDVYLASLSTTPASFSLGDNDFIRFDGSYTFRPLGEDDEIENNLGSASTLEIFAKQVGDDVELYVENIPTAGNGSSPTADITTITLTGVALDNLSFDQDTSILTASSTIV